MSSLSVAWLTFGAIHWSMPTTAAWRLPKHPNRVTLGGCARCPGGLQLDANQSPQAGRDFHRLSQPRRCLWSGIHCAHKEPTVVQVPDFGDRFYVYALYDQRTDEIGHIGKQYGTEPGFYLIVGLNWNGSVPQGITAVIRSSTDLVFVVPRVFKDDTPEDTQAVQPLLSQVMMYPLSKFDGKFKTTDWSKIPNFPVPATKAPTKSESKWVNPATYYEELPVVMKEVPPLPGEEALYGWIKSVWEAAAKDPKTKQALVESFVAANAELLDPLFNSQYNGRGVGNG